MTHEELLADIDERIEELHNAEVWDGFIHALRAVLELHKPTELTPGYPYGPYCTHEVGYEWPCPTIQAIEKELQ